MDAIIQQACVAEDFSCPCERCTRKRLIADRLTLTGYYGLSDDIAPNNSGHRAIAKAILAAIGMQLWIYVSLDGIRASLAAFSR